MLKHLTVLALLAAPCAAFGTQAMSLDDGFALAGNNSEIDTLIAPMQDGAGSADATPTSRGVDASDSHAAADNTSARSVVRPARAADGTANSTAPHGHKGHGKAPWQSLLPGVMK